MKPENAMIGFKFWSLAFAVLLVIALHLAYVFLY